MNAPESLSSSRLSATSLLVGPPAQHRHHLYRLLSTVFAREPNPAFLTALREPTIRQELEELGMDFTGAEWSRPPEEHAEHLAVEFASLFLVPGRQVVPCESVQRGEGRYWGDATVAVRRFYRRCGYRMNAQATFPPDHLSVELDFLAQLTGKEARAISRQEGEIVAALRRTERDFLTAHLGCWVGPFADRVGTVHGSGYYTGFACLTRDFVASERRTLQTTAPMD